MLEFKRSAERYLQIWKDKPDRKPLILRGARQVGKTTMVKQFARTYKNAVLLNLEKSADRAYFENYDEVSDIVELLFVLNDIALEDADNTLLFIDEIQESAKAIKMLRYFFEERPELHVIAAGSLLEFALHKIQGFPVGRVEFLFLHPLNFYEYLKAIKHKAALKHFDAIPVKPIAHPILLELFNRYAIIGGMPEVVKQYIKSDSITELPVIYESVWGTYQHDVEKYTTNETERKVIKHIITTAHYYVDQRIKFQNFGNSNYRSREVGEAMRKLDDAKVIRLIYPTTNVAIPAKPDIKKSPRLQFLDTGIVNYTAGVQPEMIGVNDLSNAYKGAIIPHLITQELISLNHLNDKKPNFWVREKKESSSEVDIVFTYKEMLIPIEVKSGKSGTLKSLHQFIDRVDHQYAIRMYGGEFRIEEAKTQAGKEFILMNLPYYLGTKLPDYIEYFVNNH
ncbi:MAG: AAA family ATPase [Bacteroidota bacterium]